MPDGHLSLPFGVQQVGPVLRRVLLGHQAVVVGDQHQGCGSDRIVIFRVVVLLEGIHHLAKIIGPVLQQQPLFLKVRVVAHIGAAEDRCHRDVGLQVLLETLQGDLRRCAHKVAFNAGILFLECRAQVGRLLGVVVGGVDGELLLLLRRFVQLLLPRGHLRPQRGGGQAQCGDQKRQKKTQHVTAHGISFSEVNVSCGF